jgi:hypothetical protein
VERRIEVITSPEHKASASHIVIQIGDEVRSREGERLGTVKELAQEMFKVDAHFARDYWLSKAHVFEVNGNIVLMDFEKNLTEDYKLAAPGAAASSPILDAQADQFPSELDRAETRRRMENGGEQEHD